MSVAELTAVRDAKESTLAAEMLNPKPTYSVGGRSVSWDSYRQSLIKEISDLNTLIIQRSGAVELHTRLLG